jgi:hypothetical protein
MKVSDVELRAILYWGALFSSFMMLRRRRKASMLAFPGALISVIISLRVGPSPATWQRSANVSVRRRRRWSVSVV